MEKRNLLEDSGYSRPNTSLEVTPVKKYDRRRKTGIFAVDAANKEHKRVVDADKAKKLAENREVEAFHASCYKQRTTG